MPKSRLAKDVYDVWQSRKGGKRRRQNHIGLERSKLDCAHARREKPSRQSCAKIKEELVSLFGENVIHMEHNKLLTLAFALTEDVVSNERLRFSLNMHKYDISKMLKDLCAEGFLVSDGIGRGTTYQLNKGEILTNNSANVVNSSSNVESSDCKKRLKKRCSRNELFNMIVECASEWISLEEIAREVQRSAKYLNNNIINKMVDNGLLKRLFPISNHPAQKYKGADKQQGEARLCSARKRCGCMCWKTTPSCRCYARTWWKMM